MRTLRHVWAALLVIGGLGGAACDGGQAGPIFRTGSAGFGATGLGGRGGSSPPRGSIWQADYSRSVDILFLIDDSSSMTALQNKLLLDFPTFLSTLQSLPGGLPDVHIGVISSDMGAGDGSIANCNPGGGKNGIFQFTPRGTCTSTKLNPGETFISSSGAAANFTGPMTDVFRCIAALGETGCGFEHQFGAIVRALGADGRPPPAENEGFLRDEATLAIIMLTNEDDCTETQGVPFFDTQANMTIASQLGPVTNFRCNEFGHICDDGRGTAVKPNRNAPGNDVAAMVTYTNCRSNEVDRYLLAVGDVANQIKAVKPDPSQVLVASIQGPTTPYVVHWKQPLTADRSCNATSCPWPEITHSCTAPDMSFGDPGVRTAELVNQFGANGLVLPICADSFAPSLQRIGEAIGQHFAPSCVAAQFEDDPTRAGLQPNCTVTAHVRQANNTVMDRVVPSCADSGGAVPCWTASRDVPECNGSATVVVTSDPVAPAASNSVTIRCNLCEPGASNPNNCW